ncbi:hypothetical protein C8J56DRAFT_1157616 [Mycena floridula]|nr:hypothetical protein C8J56DRAFT_1157616 [Mycena floridula]
MFFYKVDPYAAVYYESLIDVGFGLYFWEWFITLDFDFGFICGRQKFKWPMIFYFYARYAFLASLVATIFVLNNSWQVNCQALYITNFLLRHSALWASSVSLSIRTMMLWEYSRRIMIIILPLIALHMAAVCVGSTWDLKVVWSEHAFAHPRCVVLNVSHFGTASLYTYTVVLDFIILCLTLYKLLYGGGARIRIKRIPIFMLLFRDGLVYFVVLFIVTLFPVVFLLLNVNTAMAVGMKIVPGAATITAGRAVRRLYKYAGPVPETTGAGDGRSLTIPHTASICTESEILDPDL